jgi:hypothetical protein
MIKRYILYLLRWQLSTPILAPIIAWFTHSNSLFGTKESWIGSVVANLIGGLIFFWVDKFIFTSDKLGNIWQVKENIKCNDCDTIGRGYRLVKSKNYDKTKSPPQFRCEECSIKKVEELKKHGIKV